MILTLTPNPALDITYSVPAIELGGVHRITELYHRPGGKGINTASVLRQLGEPVTATGFLGGSTGQEVRELLATEQIPARFVDSPVPTRQSVSVTDPLHGSTIFNEAGAAQSEATWEQLFAAVREIADLRVVTVNGSFPPNTSEGTIRKLYRTLLETGAVVIVDTSGEPLRIAAEENVQVLKPNDKELAELTGLDDPEASFDEMLQRVQLMMCTMGAKGMVAQLRGGERVRMPATRFIQGNPTGAGDSATASLARSIARDGLAAAADAAVLTAWLQDARALSAATVAEPVAGQFNEALYAELR